MDNENLAHLPAYQFSLVVDNDWPNEKWGDVIIFLAHTPRTISGGVNSQIRGKLVTVNENPDLHDYYWLWANMPLSNESVILHEKGATPTSDDPIGTYFSLVMSHELTSAESFSHLPFLLNVVYPLLSLLFIFVAIISTIKDSKRLIGTLLTIDVTLIIFLLTMKYWISDYVPVWERSINSTIDSRLLWMVILLVVIVFIYMFARIAYSKLMDVVKRIKNNEKHKKTRTKHKKHTRTRVKGRIVNYSSKILSE